MTRCHLHFNVLWVISLAVCLVVNARLEDVLRHYETMQAIQVAPVRVKRSTQHANPQTKEVQFDILGRHFHLYLQVQQNLLSADFKVFAINETRQKREVFLNRDVMYQGIVLEEEGKSQVSAYWEDGDQLTATIQMTDDTYYIEPSWRHLPHSENYSLIAYRDSDLKIPENFGEKFCESISVDQPDEERTKTDADVERDADEVKGRARRAASGPLLNTCPLLLVADWKFYQKTGQNSLIRTTNYLMSLIQRVNFIYRNTDFGKGYVNMGFEIREMWINEVPTTDSGEHYNSLQDDWKTQRLLEVFSEEPDFQRFCLAHLFTHHGFKTGVLGLAYIGSKRPAYIGGVCSPVYHRDGVDLYLNTGWSTSLNRYDRTLLTREFDLVTTHELGHNWGSEHDPNTKECSPDSDHGGRYIMYTYSVSGLEHNNKILSNCSRRAIRAVLASKAPVCFTENMGKYCGNSQVEKDEECDGGIAMMKGDDPCCHDDCTYRRTAVCSDINHLCCRRCQFTPKTVVCHPDQPLTCLSSSNCTGGSHHCPPPYQKQDGTRCLNMGSCVGGDCVALCESHSLTSCACDGNASDYCRWCCMGGEGGTCRPFTPPGRLQPLLLPPGTTCKLGYCDERGKCLKQKQDLVQRIWTIIENLSPSTLVAFMRTNIVGTVIVISLTIWIPASCVICYYDRKMMSKEDMMMAWMKGNNDTLMHPTAAKKIVMHRPSKRVHQRPLASPGSSRR